MSLDSPVRKEDKQYKRCFVAGACSLALPALGVAIFLFFAFVLPSRLSYSPAAELLRVIMGTSLLLPVPLAIASLVFFLIGLSASGGERPPVLGGAGLAMSAVSASLFVLAALLAPGL